MARGGGGAGGARTVHDPVAAIKALAITAAFYFGALHIDPDHKRLNEWFEYAGTPEARIPLAAFAISVVVAVNVLANYQTLWRKAFFVNMPKTQKGVHRGCLIWLHGVGDRGHGFQWLRRELAAKEQGHVANRIRICLPDAPERVLKAAEGSKRTAWFDLAAMPITPEEPDDPEGLSAAIAGVLKYVNDAIADGIPAERVVVGGFSQGAALAAWVAAECPHKLGGVVLWSGYCPRPAELTKKLRSSPSGKEVPFIWGHGDQDTKVLPACGDQLVNAVASAGVTLRARQVYHGLGHGCTRDSIDKLGSLLQEIAPLEGLAAMKEVKRGGSTKKTD